MNQKNLKINNEIMWVRYANPIMQFISMVNPKFLYMVGGRGLSKTTMLMAKRGLDCVDQMPRAVFAFVAESYVKAMSDIIPKVMGAWEDRFNMEYGVDFVCDERPPDTWPKPINLRAVDFKHTITFKNGARFLIKSLDRPSSNAGIDAYHLFGDEAKYFAKDKMKKVFPTLRGDAILFKDAHLFMGHTFTTDMPSASDNEDEWILEMEKNMDINNIIDIYYTANEVNELNKKLITAKEEDNELRVLKITGQLKEWNSLLLQIQRNSTLFMAASSIANVDVLTFEYLMNQFKSLDYDEYKSAILSIKTFLNKHERFYGDFSNANVYGDGYKYEFYDAHSLRDNITQTCAGLKYIETGKPLEGGYDAGNMHSLIIGQEQGRVTRVLKNLYTLTPEWIDDLGRNFQTYFAPHTPKLLNLRFDRAANNYHAAGQDFANQLKKAIETRKDGRASGWTVILESVGQGNISHSTDRMLCNAVFKGDSADLPMVLFDEYECKEVISSIRLAPVKKGGIKREKVQKEKKSEKLPIHRLPMESTNFSDAFKYFICTKRNMNVIRNWKPANTD